LATDSASPLPWIESRDVWATARLGRYGIRDDELEALMSSTAAVGH
jgi:hypothetical protein